MRHQATEHDEHVNQILADFLRDEQAGRSPSRESLLARYPEAAEELAAFFDDRERFARVVAPLGGIMPMAHSAATLDTLRLGDTPNPSQTSAAGIRYGNYEVLQELARGGMGVVYKARQVKLNRVVALKMILAGQFATSADVDRFRAEAQAVAKLEHPHIVPVYEVGEENGHHYFSMKLIEGGSLVDQRETLRSQPRRAAQLLVTVARAVHYAHQRGVLHRDLKPGNILLDGLGLPHVTDFGLAKRLEDESQLTQAGAILGTPSYMAPEQARGEQNISTCADVYSLGVILYELLTGRLPFQGSTPFETLMQVTHRDPARPRSLDPAISLDLETICLKCLAKDPQSRYGTAEALADDLQRWLNGQPIQARPITATERLVKWSRRQPVLAGSLATVTAAILGLLVVSGFLWQNAEARALAVKSLDDANTQLAQVDSQLIQVEAKKTEAEQLADQQRKLADQQKALAEKISAEVQLLQQAAGKERERADLARREAAAAEQKLAQAQREALHTIYAADMQLAHAAWQTENVPSVSELLARYADPAGQEDLRGFEWQYLNRQINGARLSWTAKVEEQAGLDMIWSMAVSPDGKQVATVQSGNIVKLWSLADGKLLRIVSELEQDSKGVPKVNIASVFFADEGRQLTALARQDLNMDELMGMVQQAMGGQGKMSLKAMIAPFEFRTWTLADEKPARVEPFDPSRLQSPVMLTSVGGLNAAEGRTVFSASAFDCSPNGKYLAMVGNALTVGKLTGGDPRQVPRVQSGRLIIWNLETGQIHAQQDSPVVIFSVAFSPDGETLAIATSDGAIGVGKLDLAQPPRQLLGHHGFVYSLRFSADGSRMASSASDGLVLVWDVAAAKEIARLRDHTAPVTGIDLSPDGQTLVSASGDGNVKVWDLNQQLQRPALQMSDSRVTALRFSKVGRELVAADLSGAVKIWSSDDRKLLRELPAPTTQTLGVSFLSPSGNLMTWPSWNAKDGRIMLRNLTDGTERQIEWKDHTTQQIAFSADERLLACSDQQGLRIGIWNLADGQLLKELETTQRVLGVDLSADGKLLAQRSLGLVLWDWQAGTSRILVDESEYTSAVAFSADARRLAAVSNQTVRIWDLQTNELRTEFRPTGQAISHLVLSPDGRRVATAGISTGKLGNLKLWETMNGREVFSANFPTANITTIAFSPDGHRLAVATTPLDVTASITGRKLPSEIHLLDATPVEVAAVVSDANLTLEGTWVVESAELNGQLAKSSVGDKFTFAGDKVTIENKVKTSNPAVFRLDGTKQPAEIEFDDQPAMHGIFELHDDKLTICYGQERPAAFDSRQGLLLVLKRSQP